jgi:hypothetical protein
MSSENLGSEPEVTPDPNPLLQYLRDHPPKPGAFKPLPYWNKRGDQIEWYWSDVPAYAESVHHEGVWIGSLMRSMATKEIVGVKLFIEAIRQ